MKNFVLHLLVEESMVTCTPKGVTALFEAIATLATSKWFAGQPMAISITLALILIAMHRWGPYAATVAVVGGAVFCIASSASPQHFLIYCVGNLFALSSLLYFRLFGKEAVRGSFLKTLLYASSAYVMTAELVARFMTDWLEGDVYFKTDYPEHNLVRTRNQYWLAFDMEKKLDEMQKIVLKYSK